MLVSHIGVDRGNGSGFLLRFLLLGEAVDDNAGLFVALLELGLVVGDVLRLEFAHFLDFVEVHNEAALLSVEVLDAFATEDSAVVAAVEVRDSLAVVATELILKRGVVVVVEINRTEDWVSLYHLVEDVDVQGKSFH